MKYGQLQQAKENMLGAVQNLKLGDKVKVISRIDRAFGQIGKVTRVGSTVDVSLDGIGNYTYRKTELEKV